MLDVDWCLGKHATIPYGGETVGWSTIGYWWLQQGHPPVELHQAHGKVDAFRWVRAEARAEVLCARARSILGAHELRGSFSPRVSTQDC